jgi:hypothetical protein
LNELDEIGMIYDSRKAKSVTLSSEGEASVKKLLTKYGLTDDSPSKAGVFGEVSNG